MKLNIFKNNFEDVERFKTENIVVADYKRPDGTFYVNLLLILTETYNEDKSITISHINLNTKEEEIVKLTRKPRDEINNNSFFEGYKREPQNPNIIPSSLIGLSMAYHNFNSNFGMKNVFGTINCPDYVLKINIPLLTQEIEKFEHPEKQIEMERLLVRRKMIDQAIDDLKQYQPQETKDKNSEYSQ